MKKRTAITTTHMKKLPTSFETTAHSWLPLGETPSFDPFPIIIQPNVVSLSFLNSIYPQFSTVSEPERFSGDNVIYKPVGESVPDMVFLGSLANFDLTYAWAQDKCVPLVREITFENGEVCYLHIQQQCQLDNNLLLFGVILMVYILICRCRHKFMESVGSPSVFDTLSVCACVFSRSWLKKESLSSSYSTSKKTERA